MLYTLILLLTGISCLSVEPVQAQEQIFSMSTFLSLAEKNDPNFKKLMSEERQLSYIMDEGLPSRGFELDALYEKGYVQEDGQDSELISATVSKEILETGTTLSATHSQVTRPDRVEDVTDLRLEQSLYKNFFGRDVRLRKESLSQQEEKIRLEILESYEDYLIKIMNLYLEYRKASIEKDLAIRALADAKKLRNTVSQKKSKRIATSTDLDRSDLQLLLTRENLILKEQEVKTRWEAIKIVIGDAQAKPPKLEKIYEKDFFQEVENFSDEKLTSLRAYTVLKIQSDINQKELTLTQRSQMPDFNLVVGFSEDNSTRFSTTVNRTETVLGLSLNFPLFDSAGAATQKRAELNLFKARLDEEITLMSFKQSFQTIKETLLDQKKRLEIGQNKVIVSKRIVKDQNRRYQFGRIDLDELIETQNELTSYEQQYQSDRVEYNRTYLRWLALTDQLLSLRERLKNS